MAGTFTQHRWVNPNSIIQWGLTCFYKVGSAVSRYRYTDKDFQWSNFGQTTTSFRSGNLADELDATNEGFDPVADIPANQAGVFGYLTKDPDTRLALHPGDRGHEFSTVTSYLRSYTHFKTSGCNSGASGSIVQTPCILDMRPSISDHPGPWSDSGWYGAQCISRTIPTSPHARLANDLGQLLQRSFFPALRWLQGGPGPHSPSELATDGSLAQDYLRRQADAHVDYQFGVNPFVSDTQALLSAMADSRRILEQFARDAGRNVRRETYFDPEQSYSSGTVSNVVGFRGSDTTQSYPFSTGGFNFNSPRSGTKEVSVLRNIGFKGAYVYQLDPYFSDMTNAGFVRAQRLYGIVPTLQDVWDLTPWSFLGNWLSDIGAIIKNASYLTGPGLVLKYGYLMVETFSTVTWTVTAGWPLGIDPGSHYDYGSTGPVSTSTAMLRKQRIRATPYGFGLNPAGFSDLQWSILGALGLSKAWKALW